jgi:D-galactose 1-dehydrogenase
MARYGIGLIGLGKIATDQHVPVIAADPDFEVVAVASQRGNGLAGVTQCFRNWRDLLRDAEGVDAVAICTPPQVRHVIARAALAAGKHVLLEKPPAATVSELVDLQRHATSAGKTLFATWHSQFNAGVEEARRRLAGKQVRRLEVTWKEDVRHWHPGQAWIWEPGGFGVFDPGINALSIVTRILPAPIFVRESTLSFPANRAAPIAADLVFTATGSSDEHLTAVFDWRQTGRQSWDIAVDTQDGVSLLLSEGGSRLAVDGVPTVDEPPREYQGIYRRFAELLSSGGSDVDADPFRLVADAFLVGRRVEVDTFED